MLLNITEDEKSNLRDITSKLSIKFNEARFRPKELHFLNYHVVGVFMESFLSKMIASNSSKDTDLIDEQKYKLVKEKERLEYEIAYLIEARDIFEKEINVEDLESAKSRKAEIEKEIKPLETKRNKIIKEKRVELLQRYKPVFDKEIEKLINSKINC